MDQKPKGKVEIVEGTVKRYNEEHQQQVPSDNGSLSQMSRLPTTPNTSIVSLTSPFIRRSLRTIWDAFSAAYTTKYFINPAETHAAVLVPFCNPDGNPGLLLEVQRKLRAHSGEVRCALSCFSR